MRPRVARAPRRHQPAGRVIVVGGHTRGVGKTTLVEQLLRTWSGGAVAAVKISAHRHAPEGLPAPVIEEALDASPATQTGRYLAAGADRAWLCRCPSERMPDAARFVRSLRDQGWDVVVESNRIVRYLTPDLTFFVASAGTDDWKASSAECLRCADVLALSAGTSTVPLQARALAGSSIDRLPVIALPRPWDLPGLWSHAVHHHAAPIADR